MTYNCSLSALSDAGYGPATYIQVSSTVTVIALQRHIILYTKRVSNGPIINNYIAVSCK